MRGIIIILWIGGKATVVTVLIKCWLCTVSSVVAPSQHLSPSTSNNNVLYDCMTVCVGAWECTVRVYLDKSSRNKVSLSCHWCKREIFNVCDLLPLCAFMLTKFHSLSIGAGTWEKNNWTCSGANKKGLEKWGTFCCVRDLRRTITQEKKTRSTVLNPRRAKEFVVPSTLRRCIAS